MTRYIRIGLVLISIVWTIVNFIITIATKAPLVNLLGLVGLVPLLTVLYQDIDWIFIKINKIRAWLSQKTVSFSVKHQIKINNFDDIQSLDKKVRAVFIKFNFKIDESKSPNRTHETIYYQIKNEQNLSFLITVSAMKLSEEQTNFILKVDYQIAYRDVKQKWEDFMHLERNIFSLYSRDEKNLSRFDISIDTSRANFNPFYRLTIRHLTNVRINKFNLVYSEDKLTVTSTLHKIQATSDSEIDIKKLIDEYVPLSKVL